MGTPYPNTTASGYNSSPPPDDGSVTAANKVTWAKIKGQLSDPLNTFDSTINTNLRTALNVTPTSQSTAYTTTTADHQRPIEVTGTTTISLGDAATMVAATMGYAVPIVNVGAATVTVAVITATDKIAGRTNGTVTLAPGQGLIFTVNSTSNGYDITAATGFAPVVLTGAAGTNTATANAPANLYGLYAGLIVVWTPAATNTGATTLAITPSGGTALAATNVFVHGAACTGGELKASVPLLLEYDGTQLNVMGAGADGFATQNAGTVFAGPATGAAAAPTFRAIAGADASLVLIDSKVASNSATLDFTTGISSTYDEYQLHLVNVLPVTNAVSAEILVSTDGGSTFKTGVADYSNGLDSINSANVRNSAGNASAAFMGLNPITASNTLDGISGVIKFYAPSSSTLRKEFTIDITYVDSAGPNRVRVYGFGAYIGSTTAVNAVRFLFSSGNVSSGAIYLYGVRKS